MYWFMAELNPINPFEKSIATKHELVAIVDLSDPNGLTGN
jgi:hypothetical protein